MKSYLLLAVCNCLLLFSSCGGPTPKTDLAGSYTQAITNFIDSASVHNGAGFDTLYFLNHKYGQPDDFPDIELPKKIGNTQIVLVDPAKAEKDAKQVKSRVYINLIGWVENETAEFMFVVFANGFEHKYDCTINYATDGTTKQPKLASVKFKDGPF